MQLRRIVAVTATSGVILAASAVGAFAAVDGNFSLGTTGVTFTSGYYKFKNGGSDDIDFYYSGYLKDTQADGNNVFVHGKVAGYGYGTKLYNNGGSGTVQFKSQNLNDPAASRVDTARVEACQDRGTFVSDLCDDQGFSQ